MPFEAVFNHATIAMLVCNTVGHITSANRAACALFGYTEDEMLGLGIDALVPDSVAGRHERLRQSFNAEPQVRAMGHGRDLYAKRKDGSVFPAEISLSYYYQQEQLYVASYILDITYKKESEKALLTQNERIEQLNAQLEHKVAERTHALLTTLQQLEHSKDELAKALTAERELGELKSRFVSMASHEFRTPLSAVLTSASLLEKYPNTEQQAQRLRHIQRIKASVNHLNDILEEFLSVGRLEEGRVEAHRAEVDVAQLAQDVVTDLQPLHKPGQHVHTTFDCSRPIRTDPSLLRKILLNLLSNALKYSAEGQPVRLTGHCGDVALRLVVEDEGIGISDDDQKHLFERFFRAKNAVNHAGTGLGLHIVANYVNLLGGSVNLFSQLGRGTTVTLTLPYENDSAH